jgi:hypothetical protein
MAQESWHLTGEYFEACNCDLICPCLVQAPPSRGRCDAALAFHITDGTYGQTVLNDRTTVLVVSFPGPGKMRDGDWTAVLYIDAQASPAQQEALGQIFSGKVGGPMRGVSLLWSHFLGVHTAPITFTVEGNTRHIVIPDILEVAVAAVPGRDGSEPVWATNAGHPVSSRLALAQATVHRYRDHNLAWNISGTNGHFAPFHWQP